MHKASLEVDKQEESDSKLSIDLQVNFDFILSLSPEVAKLASCFPPAPESPKIRAFGPCDDTFVYDRGISNDSLSNSLNSTHCAASAIGMITQY